MRLSLRKSLYLITLSCASLNLGACTTSQTDAMSSEEALTPSSEESKSLSDVDANSSVTIEEPTAEENAALAAATANDFNDPKDVQLNSENNSAVASEAPAVATDISPEAEIAPVDTSVANEIASVPADTGVEGSTIDSTVVDDATLGASMDSSASEIAPVLFAKNKTKISRSYKKQLNQLAMTLKDDCKAKIIVSGHSDSRGSAKYNKRLALKRAKAVKSYLVSRGVKPSQIKVKSHGSEMLVAHGSTEAEQAQNRRVEIQMLAH